MDVLHTETCCAAALLAARLHTVTVQIASNLDLRRTGSAAVAGDLPVRHRVDPAVVGAAGHRDLTAARQRRHRPADRPQLRFGGIGVQVVDPHGQVSHRPRTARRVGDQRLGRAHDLPRSPTHTEQSARHHKCRSVVGWLRPVQPRPSCVQIDAAPAPRRTADGGRGSGSAAAQPSAGRAPQLAVVVGTEFGNPPAPGAEPVQRVRHKAKLTSLVAPAWMMWVRRVLRRDNDIQP